MHHASCIIFLYKKKQNFPVINIHLLNLFQCQHGRTMYIQYSHLPPLLAVIFHPPPCGQPLPFSVETISPILAVNFHPTYRSYSTLLLAVNIHPSPWRPSHPSWRSPPTRLWCFKRREVRGGWRRETGDERQGDRETRRREDREAGRQGDKETGRRVTRRQGDG